MTILDRLTEVRYDAKSKEVTLCNVLFVEPVWFLTSLTWSSVPGHADIMSSGPRKEQNMILN